MREFSLWGTHEQAAILECTECHHIFYPETLKEAVEMAADHEAIKHPKAEPMICDPCKGQVHQNCANPHTCCCQHRVNVPNSAKYTQMQNDTISPGIRPAEVDSKLGESVEG